MKKDEYTIKHEKPIN